MEEIYNDEILLTIDLSEATDGFDILDAAAGILDESVKTNFGG